MYFHRDREEEQVKRVQRAQTQQLYLIEQSGLVCKVTGTTGNLYELDLSLDTCSCPDATTGMSADLGILCKHLCFAKLKIFNKPIDYVLKDSDVVRKKALLAETNRADTSCIICYDSFEADPEYKECAKCKNIIHETCFRRWLSFNKNTCVYCRALIR